MTMGKKEKCVDKITVLLTKEIAPKLKTLCTERHSFIQYQKASAELEHLTHVLRAYEWSNHCAKASHKDAVTICRDCSHMRIYLALLCICDACALYDLD
jgi:structural maintenance of chromosome 2